MEAASHYRSPTAHRTPSLQPTPQRSLADSKDPRRLGPIVAGGPQHPVDVFRFHLRESGGLGPESINELLTRQSGLTGLVGEPTTLDRVMRGDSPESRFARSVFEHRLLLAAGAAVAALGGVDGIVLSGRYAGASGALGTFLVDRLRALPGLTSQPIELLTFPVGVDRLVADQVFATALSEPTSARALI